MTNFKKTSASFLLGLVLMSCSSQTPSTTSWVSERDEAVKAAHSQLNDWEKRADRIPSPDSAAKLKAAIADARVDVRAMEGSAQEQWTVNRNRVNADLARIRNQYGFAE